MNKNQTSVCIKIDSVAEQELLNYWLDNLWWICWLLRLKRVKWIDKTENVLMEGPIMSSLSLCLIFNTETYAHTHMYTHINAQIYLHTHKYTNTHKYTCTHTHIHTISPLNCSMAVGDKMRHNVNTTATVNELLDDNCIKRFR